MPYSLVRFRNEIRKEQGHVVIFRHNEVIFQVLGVYMYLCDRTVEKSFPQHLINHPFLYDIVLSDGRKQLKCLLDINLDKMVQHSELTAGIRIVVHEAWCIHFGEDEVLVLKSISIKQETEKPLMNPVQALPFLLGTSSRELNKFPLISRRSTYLNTWASSMPYGDEWNQPDTCLTLSQNQRDFSCGELGNNKTNINELFETSKVLPPPHPRLLVRIFYKGKLHNYGKPRKNHPCPFQGYFIVGDHTGLCTMTIWDLANLGTYNFLNPGDLITLKGYKAVKCNLDYQHVDCLQTMPDLPSLLPIQLQVNYARNITRCTPAEVFSFHGNGVTLPELQYNFKSHDQIRACTADSFIDVVGLVTHAGNLMREKMEGGDGYWVYQWLELRDHTNSTSIPVLLYPNEVSPLYPNSLVALNCVMVVRDSSRAADDNEEGVFSYLLSTSETEVFYFDHRSKAWGPKMDEPTAKKCLEWSDGGTGNLKSQSTVGGLDLTPIFFPQDFPSYFRKLPEHEQQTARQHCNKEGLESWLHGFKSSWQHLWKELAYREHRYTLFYGSLIRVEYVSFPKEEGMEPQIRTLWQRPYLHKTGYHEQLLESAFNWALAQYYECPAKKKLMNGLKFPAFSTDLSKSNNYRNDNHIHGIPYFKSAGKGFYSLILGNKEEKISLTTLFFPEPTAQPQPGSLLELLTHQHPLDRDINWKTFDTEHLNSSIAKSAKDMWNKDYLFVVDLVSMDRQCQLAILRQLYNIPSELPPIEIDMETEDLP